MRDLRSRLRSCERGSVSVEFAATLPLVAISMLLVAQIGLLVAQQMTIRQAAREGARAAAVGADGDAARARVLEAGNLDDGSAVVEVAPAAREVGDPVTVTVRYAPGLMPIVGRFIGDDFRLVASVTMRTERAPDGSDDPDADGSSD